MNISILMLALRVAATDASVLEPRCTTAVDNQLQSLIDPADAAVHVDVELTEVRCQNRDPVRFEHPRFSAPTGKRVQGLEQLQTLVHELCENLERDSHPGLLAGGRQEDDFEHGIVGCSFKTRVNRGVFVYDSVCNQFVGPYPAVNCVQSRLRTDTGKTWTYLDAISPPQRKAFFVVCTQALQKAREKHRSKFGPGDWEQLAEPYLANVERDDGTFHGPCTERALTNAGVAANGDLHLSMDPGLGHCCQAAGFDVVMPRAVIAPFLDKNGPLGFLLEKESQK